LSACEEVTVPRPIPGDTIRSGFLKKPPGILYISVGCDNVHIQLNWLICGTQGSYRPDSLIAATGCAARTRLITVTGSTARTR
jgi:hypothetical protein